MDVYDIVEVKSTGSDLDGKYGRIIGKGNDNCVIQQWIVYLDKEFMGQRGVNLPETCLQKRTNFKPEDWNKH